MGYWGEQVLGNLKTSKDGKGARRQAAGLITPAIVGIGVALGCTLAWPLMAFQSMNLYVGLAHCEWILDRAYLLSIVATTVTLALCGIFHKQFDRLLGSASARYLFPIGMAVCTLLVLGAGNEGTAAQRSSPRTA